MKYLILGLLIAFSSFNTLDAQKTEPTTEHKQAINPLVDEGFTSWSKSWSFDRYVGRSARIKSIKVDEDYGDIEVDGVFNYKRLMVEYEGSFTAKINSSGRLVNISYIDANGVRGSKSF